ncbi:MAG: hypothetical protein ACJ73J_09225 [Actinomycetes bacterium]
MGIEPGALAGVVLYAKDVERVATFYAAVLRLEVIERDANFVVLSQSEDGNTGTVSVVGVPPEIAEAIVLQDPPIVREETPIKPSFLVQSLADAVTVAHASGGGTKRLDAAWEFRGLRHLDGFDPEGNAVQFVERLEAKSLFT